MAAVTMPLVLASLAIGLDYGNLTLQNRTMQATADMGAIVASSNIAAPEAAVLNYFTTNKMNLGVVSGTTLLTAKGTVPFDARTVFNGRDGYATLTKGHYVPDTAVAAGSRFQPGASPGDSIQLNLFRRAP